MISRLRILAMTGLAGIVLFVPGGADAATPRTFHHADSGRTVRVSHGATFRIDLRTSVDGGYSWHLVRGRHSAHVKVIDRATRPYPHAAGTVGYPYHTIYTLKATRRGAGTLRLVERRSWDKADVASRFVLHVHVVRR